MKSPAFLGAFALLSACSSPGAEMTGDEWRAVYGPARVARAETQVGELIAFAKDNPPDWTRIAARWDGNGSVLGKAVVCGRRVPGGSEGLSDRVMVIGGFQIADAPHWRETTFPVLWAIGGCMPGED